MALRWKNRPEGSNWGEFGEDDQLGRLNLLTPERRLAAREEIIAGRNFCLSLPLDLPGKRVLIASREEPVFHPVMKETWSHFNLPMRCTDPSLADVSSDEAVFLYNQYSTHWDSFAHKGMLFDADGDGEAEAVFYNGFQIVDEAGQGTQGKLGATALSVSGMAETGVQGRGVLIDLRHHLGDERVSVGYDLLRSIMDKDNVSVEPGDIVCVHTGLSQLIMDAQGNPPEALRTACAVLDGGDQKLLDWVTESGLVAIAADNVAVERSGTLARPDGQCECDTRLPLHRHCLFKLGVHLGELWYLTELAAWLRQHGRSRFFLTAPPLRLPGAVGSPLTPVATV